MLPELSDADWEAMTEEERTTLLDDLESLAGGESLREAMIRRAPHHVPPPHMNPLIGIFEEARVVQDLKVAISMPPGHGKRIADSVPVITPDGWRTHGDLKVGDYVFALDGTPTRVSYVSPSGPTDLDVVFSDGEVVRTHAGHLWTVFSRGGGYRTVETGWMASRLISGKCRNGKARARFMVDGPGPLQFPQVDLPIDPYVFGLWLGDGSTGTGRISAAPADAAIEMEEIRRRGYRIGAINVHKTTGVLTYCVLDLHIRKVLKGKYIPGKYIFASEGQRRDLLRGLVDSDGHVSKNGRCRFVNANRRLIDDVVELVRTLGYRATVEERRPRQRAYPFNNCKIHWCVSWTPRDGAQPALLPRKDIRTRALPRRRSIVAIVPCAPENGKCITVEHKSHLYLVGRALVPTHNTYVFQHGIAWWLTKFPADTCAYTSYNASQAFEKSSVTRMIAEADGVSLSEETNSKALWRTEAGGGLAAGGIKSLTGKRVQGPLVVDDPYAGFADAFSAAYREEFWNEFQTVSMTRREGGAPLVLCHTRWHPDDAIGRLKRMQREGKIRGWRFINLPAIKPDGTALWPDVYPMSTLTSWREDMGEYNFSALYQGEPRPRGSALFGDPHYYDPTKTSFEGCRLVISADPAASVKTSADYSAAGVIAMRGYDAETVGYIRHAYRKQVTIPQFAEDLLLMQMEWGNAPIYVESVGAFKAVPQILRQLKPDISVVEVTPQGDKFQRAQRAAAAWNQGRLMVPHIQPTEDRPNPVQAKWLGPLLDELALFTGVNDAHDDQVDWISQGWNSGGLALSIYDVV